MLVGSGAHYRPPASCQHLLGAISNLLSSKETIILRHLMGAVHICQLPGGQIYFDSKLYVDSDGSRYAAQDKTGQAATSLRYRDKRSVDADQVPYFVLPGGFYSKHHISLGDIAAVLYQGKLAFAVFADVGPASKIGEASIALHRAIGHETIRNGRFRDVGIDRNVITIVFPRSGDHTPQTPTRVEAVGRRLFSALATAQ